MSTFRVHAIILLAVVAGLLPVYGADAAEQRSCTASSGAQKVALLELYTSEGCDSCPPADRWIRELPQKKLTADRVVPLAFHVDYWNHIGWVDPYAQRGFSERQRAQASRRRATFVYTPQFILNGQDYRRGLVFDDLASQVKTINQDKPGADLKLSLTRSAAALETTVDATLKNGAQRTAQLYIALYENKLSSRVSAGENRGRTLEHDFVVRELAGPFGFEAGSSAQVQHRFRIAPSWRGSELNVAAFVQHPLNGDVLQALAAACQ